MSTSIDQLVDQLPTSGLTVRALQLLDFVSPGSWQNLTGFDKSIQQITGESDPDTIARVRQRALELYNDSSQGYQRATWIYQFVDHTDSKLGLAAMAHKVGESFSLLSFLDRITPAPEKAQTIDLAMKIVAECAAFCYTNGLPGDGVSDFVSAMSAYEKENLIRMTGIVVFDGLIPLGPHFADKLMNLDMSAIEDNAFYQRAKALLPGDIPSIVNQTVGSIGEFASNHGITLDRVLPDLKGVIDFSEDKLDYLGAVLDMTVSYMEHTGVQSVARSLIERAVGEI